VDTIGNVQNLHHRDFGQVPATMAENVTIMKTSPVVLKRQKPLVEKKVETKDVVSETTAIED
jgi:hypothetical protein